MSLAADVVVAHSIRAILGRHRHLGNKGEENEVEIKGANEGDWRWRGHLVTAEAGDDLGGTGGEEEEADERWPHQIEGSLPERGLQVILTDPQLPPANLHPTQHHNILIISLKMINFVIHIISASYLAESLEK